MLGTGKYSTLVIAVVLLCPLKGMAASDDRLTQVGSMMSVDFAALVSKADLDFKVPLGDSKTERGLPIGNGRVGTLLWTNPDQSKLHMQINHTDVFAFRSSSVVKGRDRCGQYCNGCGFADIDLGGDVFRADSIVNHLGVHVIIMENITEGERAREYMLEGKVGETWQKIGGGACIGHKRIERITPVEVTAVRLNVLKSAATPLIRKLAVYNTQTS